MVSSAKSMQLEVRQHGRPSLPAPPHSFVTEASTAPMLQGCLLELIDGTPGLVMVSSSRGGLVYMNNMGRRMLGIGEQEDIY